MKVSTPTCICAMKLHSSQPNDPPDCMRSLLPVALISALLSFSFSTKAQAKFLLGIVSISANEANNQRFIQAATKEAASKGWETTVIDAQGSADQANAAIRIWSNERLARSLTWFSRLVHLVRVFTPLRKLRFQSPPGVAELETEWWPPTAGAA